MTDMAITRSGFAAIIGAPNAGKSTLTNRLVGVKVAIVTHKVQTTRFPVRGVAHVDGAQIVLVDTPGIFRAKKRLDRAMVKSAWSGADDADAIVHLIDASCWVAEKNGEVTGAQKKSLEDDRRIIDTLKEHGKTALLGLNKIDLFPHEQILPLIAELSDTGVYDEIFMMSAENGDGIDRLAQALSGMMPEGPAMYPPDQTADLPMRLLAAEVTREKLMLRLHQELPYELTVETESWEDYKNGDVKISQVVIVGRDGHKGIVLGKGGQTLKAVGRMSREELTELMGQNYAGRGLEFDV